MQNVGGDGYDLDAAGRERADRLADRRMVERDNADTLRLAVQIVQQSGRPIRIEAFDGGDANIEIGSRLRFDVTVQHLDEGVGAAGQGEVEPYDNAGQGEALDRAVRILGDVAKPLRHPEWQNFLAGQYALGIEPSTHHVLGNLAARERGEMIWLEHGESRSYNAVFRVLDGVDEITAADRRHRHAVAAGLSATVGLSEAGRDDGEDDARHRSEGWLWSERGRARGHQDLEVTMADTMKRHYSLVGESTRKKVDSAV